jgi:low affinity Fe/Cu permease
MHLKLDELLRASHAARNTLVDLENMRDDELVELEDEFRRLRELACREPAAKKGHSR